MVRKEPQVICGTWEPGGLGQSPGKETRPVPLLGLGFLPLTELFLA